MSNNKSNQDADDDLECGALWGAQQIAAYIGRSPRQVYDLLNGGHLPAKKVSKTWVSTRRAMRKAMEGRG